MDFDFPEVLGFRPQQTTKFFRTLIVAEALHLKHLSQCNIAPLLSKSAVRAKPPRLLRFSHLIRYVYKTKQSPVFSYFGSLCGLVIIRNTASKYSEMLHTKTSNNIYIYIYIIFFSRLFLHTQLPWER